MASSGLFVATQYFTPAAAAYSAGDVIETAKALTWTTNKGERFDGGPLMIISTSLQVRTTALQSGEASYSVPIYGVTPPSALADNAAWDVPSGDRDAYQRLISLGAPVDLGSTLQIDQDQLNIPINVDPSGLSYAYLQTVGGFTATAVARRLILFGLAFGAAR